MSQKSCFKISPVFFFGGGEFSPTLKPDFESCLELLPKVPFPGGVMGKKFGGKSSASPNFAPRDSVPAHKVLCKKPFFRAFSPPARGSGGEQLSLILKTKSERPLTQLSVVKVKMFSLVNN